MIDRRRRDARSLDHKTLEEMRRLGVKQVGEGKTQVEVAQDLEVHRTTVWKWKDKFAKHGEAGLVGTKATGRPPKLSEEQRAELKADIITKTPEDFGLGVQLWTLPIIRTVIQEKFQVSLHFTTVSRMLDRLGITPQKPMRRAVERDEAAITKWKNEDFPAIAAEAKATGATILFEDETQVREDALIGTTWGEKGKRPVVRVPGTRRRVNVISFLSPTGRLWFECYNENLDATLFIAFLTVLLREIPGKIELILDKHPAHVARATTQFVKERSHRLALHFLPGYAPDLNPDEHVWHQLKDMFKRDPLRKDEIIIEAVQLSMGAISADRRLTQSLFAHPESEYVRKALAA